MKTLKVICIQLVLALFLSVPAFAGDISTPGITTPPPIPTQGTGMSDSSGAAIMEPVSTTSGVLDSADLIQLIVALVF